MGEECRGGEGGGNLHSMYRFLTVCLVYVVYCLLFLRVAYFDWKNVNLFDEIQSNIV